MGWTRSCNRVNIPYGRTNFFTLLISLTLIVATFVVRDIIINFEDTLTTLLISSEKYIKSLVKETHRMNSARAANAKILIPHNAILELKIIFFVTKYEEMCDTLLTLAIIHNI